MPALRNVLEISAGLSLIVLLAVWAGLFRTRGKKQTQESKDFLAAVLYVALLSAYLVLMRLLGWVAA